MDKPLFKDQRLRLVLENEAKKMKDEVEAIPSDRFLNTSPVDLAEALVGKYKVEPLALREDQAAIETSETKKDVSRDPARTFMYDHRQGPLMVNATLYELHIPFVGDEALFECEPDQSYTGGVRGRIQDGCLVLSQTVEGDDPEAINRGFDESLGYIKDLINWGAWQINGFNSVLPEKARSAVEARRGRLLRAANAASSLKFPVRQRQGDAATYVVPTARKKVAPSLPLAPNTPFAPDPTIDMAVYEDVLRALWSMSMVIERNPASFSHLDEEAIRDHFLLNLNALFEGAATGETFNGGGKTDILIRHEGQNLFIGECKFWGGPKKFSETIDQLMGYVTWRDTKTAILVFNRGTDTSKVLIGIKAILEEHPRFKRMETASAQGQMRAILGQERDPNREVILEIMLFDIPGKQADQPISASGAPKSR
jgi:hypothetical protein